VPPAGVYGARSAVRELARSMGFHETAIAELVIVVSELASNILKYAGSGEIALSRVERVPGGTALEITARDAGPPIADFATALRDGWTDRAPIDPAVLLRRPGLGAGLGAVARLTDELSYVAEPTGKAIICLRYLKRPPSARARRAGSGGS
jgi:serine/threonine-protein kinase RsbT